MTSTSMTTVGPADWNTRLAKWREDLKTAKAKAEESASNTAQAMLDLAACIAMFKRDCDGAKVKGTFASTMKQTLGWSDSVASKWLQIGREAVALEDLGIKLPASHEALYQLATMSEPERANIVARQANDPLPLTVSTLRALAKGNGDNTIGDKPAPRPISLSQPALEVIARIIFRLLDRREPERDDIVAAAEALEQWADSRGVTIPRDDIDIIDAVAVAVEKPPVKVTFADEEPAPKSRKTTKTFADMVAKPKKAAKKPAKAKPAKAAALVDFAARVGAEIDDDDRKFLTGLSAELEA